MDHLLQLQALFERLADQQTFSGLTIPVSNLTAPQVMCMGNVELNPRTAGSGLFSFIADNGKWYLKFAGSNTVDYYILVENFKISLQHFIVGIPDHNDRANIIKAITDKITTFRDNLPKIEIASSERVPLQKIIEYLQSKGVLPSDAVASNGNTTVFDSSAYIELLVSARVKVRRQTIDNLLLAIDEIETTLQDKSTGNADELTNTEKITFLHSLGIVDAITEQCKDHNGAYNHREAGKVISMFTGVPSESIRKYLEAIYGPNPQDAKNNPLRANAEKIQNIMTTNKLIKINVCK